MKSLLIMPLWFLFMTTDLFAATAQPAHPPALPTPDAVDIRDIKDVIVQPEVNTLWYELGGGLLLLFLVIALFVFLKKRRKEVQSLRAHEKALQDLESARSLMTPDNAGVFAVSLADILRQYIEDRFHISMQNLTTREFLQELMDNPETTPSELQTHDKMLGDWLTHCDLVKFARYTLTKNEIEQMFNSVSDFITATRHEDDSS